MSYCRTRSVSVSAGVFGLQDAVTGQRSTRHCTATARSCVVCAGRRHTEPSSMMFQTVYLVCPLSLPQLHGGLFLHPEILNGDGLCFLSPSACLTMRISLAMSSGVSI